MKTITIFETPAELINACANTRAEGDKSPMLPDDVTIVIRGNNIEFEGEKAILYQVRGFGTTELVAQLLPHTVKRI